MTKEKFRDAYKAWLEDNDLAPQLADSFFRKLYERWPMISPKRKMVDFERTQGVVGCELNAEVVGD
jgi:hypothetical protein